MIKKWLGDFAKYNRTVRELNSLSNRELNDLGIQRESIKKIAKGAIN